MGVIATPDIQSFDLTDREHFIILGCDGLWGVFLLLFIDVPLLVCCFEFNNFEVKMAFFIGLRYLVPVMLLTLSRSY